MLNCRISIIPSPPDSFDSQTSFHEAHAIFLLSEPQPHKNILCNLTISFFTITSILYKDKKNRGRADNTELIRQSLLAIEMNLPFHLLNLFLTFSTISSQNLLLLWHPPTSKPRYLNGVFIIFQFKIAANYCTKRGLHPTPPTLLF